MTPLRLCAQQRSLFQLFCPERDFTQGLGGCSSTALPWRCCNVAGWTCGQGRENRDPLSAVWLTRSYFLSLLFWVLLPVPAAWFPASGLCSGQNQKTEKTHTHTPTRKSPLPCWSSLKRWLFFHSLLIAYFLESANCWFLYFILLSSVWSVTEIGSNELRQIWSPPEVLFSDFEMVFFGPVFFIQE